jgi:U3 small nucleolar RNA-associated protein 7
MKHRLSSGNQVSALMFAPYEDVLGVGHTNGYSSLVIPGSGEANFDAYEANPFETKR